MQAVGRIEFQPFITGLVIGLYFVNIPRAKAGAGAAVFGITGLDT